MPGAGLLVSAQLQGGLCGAGNGHLFLFAQQLCAAVALPPQSRKSILFQIQVGVRMMMNRGNPIYVLVL